MTQDPDALYDDAPVTRIEIVCRRNGALSVGGDIGNLAYALAVLENAKDALRSYHTRRPITIPGKDTSLGNLFSR